MPKSAGGGWSPKTFEEVVAKLESMSVKVALLTVGTRTCPAPRWDAGRAYRVTLVHDVPTIQRLLGGTWERAPLEEPRTEGEPVSKARTTETRLFICHSSEDVDLATALTSLVDGALTVPTRWLRCTSVHGYKLEPGADAPAELRENLHDSAVVVGLLTPSSLDSAYVLMELGAAWGFKSWVVPLLVPGIPFKDIPGPIGQTVHAARAADEGDVASLLESIEKRCDMPWRTDAARRHTLVNDFVSVARGYRGTVPAPRTGHALSALGGGGGGGGAGPGGPGGDGGVGAAPDRGAQGGRGGGGGGAGGGGGGGQPLLSSLVDLAKAMGVSLPRAAELRGVSLSDPAVLSGYKGGDGGSGGGGAGGGQGGGGKAL